MPAVRNRPSAPDACFDDPRTRALLDKWAEVTRTGRIVGWSLQVRLRGRRILIRRGLGCHFTSFGAALAEIVVLHWNSVHLDIDTELHSVISDASKLHLLPHDEALGLMSLRVRIGSNSQSWSPTSMLADNRGYMRRVRATLAALDIPVALFWRAGGTIETFRARCFVLLANSPTVVETSRSHCGHVDDPLDTVELRRMANGLHDWMLRNTDAAGRTTYRVNGADGSLPNKNNAIRQFMATIVLHRAALRGLGGTRAFSDQYALYPAASK